MQRDGGPGGPGAGGNPTGGSFTGPAEALEIIGDFGYAYSGAIPLNNETKTALEFKTGNFMIVSETQVTGRVAGMGASKELGLIISLNGTKVLQQQQMTNTATGGMGMDYDSFIIIIPPYTEVKVELYSNDTGNIDFYATMTGRIYRG